MLQVIYEDISAHLRATDEKRDRLVNLYITLTTAAITAMATLIATSPDKFSDYLILIGGASLFLFLLGFPILNSEASSRKWHAVYMNCSIIVQRLMQRNSVIFENTLVPEARREKFPVPPHSSRSFSLTSGIIFLAGAAAAGCFLAGAAAAGYFPEKWWDWFPIPVIAIVVLLLKNIDRLNSWLADCERQFWANPGNIWCLAFLENSTTSDSTDIQPGARG
jgi:hypothetical protein